MSNVQCATVLNFEQMLNQLLQITISFAVNTICLYFIVCISILRNLCSTNLAGYLYYLIYYKTLTENFHFSIDFI